MAALRAMVLSALASVGAGVVVHDAVAMQNLTICNAYADNKPLSIYTLTNKAKLTEEPLGFKACKMISLELAEGERIDFKLGGLSVGTFRVTGLPYTTANLLLVPYHRGNGTMSAAFESHSFSLAERAQVAVVDAYAGSASGAMKIQVGSRKSRQAQSAELKSGSSVSLAAGKYQISLEDAKGKRIKAIALEATDNMRYVVMRVGSEGDGQTQELVVSPASGNEGSAGSGSLRATLGIFAAAAAATASMAATTA